MYLNRHFSYVYIKLAMNHLLFMETKSTAECAIFILLNNRTDMILNSSYSSSCSRSYIDFVYSHVYKFKTILH